MGVDFHIEGMGITGSAVARMLDKSGYSFTWHDNDSPVKAWNLSTGIISPDHPNRKIWMNVMGSDYLPFVEKSPFWFYSKNEPHKGKNGIIDDTGLLRRSGMDSLHFNVQEFVLLTRAKFANSRSKARSDGAPTIVSHGFDKRRIARYMWG